MQYVWITLVTIVTCLFMAAALFNARASDLLSQNIEFRNVKTELPTKKETQTDVSKKDCGTPNPVDSSTQPQLIVGISEPDVYKIWDESERHQLTYCISDRYGRLKDRVVEAFLEATRDWMTHANVTFTYHPEEDSRCDKGNDRVLFRVEIKNSRRTKYRGRAFFPGTPQAGRRVFLKRKYVEDYPSDLKRLVLHELGHVLGFRHEHIHENSVGECPERDKSYQPVTDYDQLSIMHYGLCGGTNRSGELSELDKQGAAKVYPKSASLR